MNKYNKIFELYDKDMSIARIAEACNMSRANIYLVIKKYGNEEQKLKLKEKRIKRDDTKKREKKRLALQLLQAYQKSGKSKKEAMQLLCENTNYTYKYSYVLTSEVYGKAVTKEQAINEYILFCKEKKFDQWEINDRIKAIKYVR